MCSISIKICECFVVFGGRAIRVASGAASGSPGARIASPRVLVFAHLVSVSQRRCLINHTFPGSRIIQIPEIICADSPATLRRRRRRQWGVHIPLDNSETEQMRALINTQAEPVWPSIDLHNYEHTPHSARVARTARVPAAQRKSSHHIIRSALCQPTLTDLRARSPCI